MINLQELIIRQFKGRNLKTSPSDMDHHQCQTIRDLEISYKPGMLTRGFGYELAGDVLGAGYVTDGSDYVSDGVSGNIGTIANLHEWRNNNADIFVIFDTTNEKVRYWNNSAAQWDQLDDGATYSYGTMAYFYDREDSLIIGSGTGATDYPVYVNYYDAITKFGAASYSAGYYDARNELTWTTDFSITNADKNAVTTDDYGIGLGNVNYYAALQYDNGQVGDLSPVLYRNSTTATACIRFTASISSDNAAQAELGNRATGIVFYRLFIPASMTKEYVNKITTLGGKMGFKNVKKADYATWEAARYLCAISFENPSTDDVDWMPFYFESNGAFSTDTPVGNYMSTNKALPTTDAFVNCYIRAVNQSTGVVSYKRITSSNTLSGFVVDSALTEGNYDYSVVSRWFTNGANYECGVYDGGELTMSVVDHRNHSYQEIPDVNYKFAIVHHKRMFVAPVYLVYDAELHNNWLAVSNINGDGNYEYDVFTNFISLEDYGVNEIRGLGRLLDFLIIFTENDIFKLNISSGSEFNWSLEETLDNVGLEANDSLTYIVGDEFKYSGYYYVSRDGFRVYDGYKSILLPTPDSPANYPLNVTTLSEAKGAYNERLKQWIISFPTNSKTYKFDLRTGEFVEPAYNDEIDVWCETSGGNLLGCDGASIWVFDNDGTNDLTTYDGDTLDPYWKSKVYNMGSSRLEKILHEVTIRYKSNTELLFKYYIDGGSVQTMNGSPFTDNSAMTTVTAGFPIGTRGYEFEFELSCADTDTNTSFEVDHIIVGYEMGQTGRIE